MLNCGGISHHLGRVNGILTSRRPRHIDAVIDALLQRYLHDGVF